MSASTVALSPGAQVFAIAELCSLICDSDHFGPGDLKTISNLALVSHSISEVALDALWSNINGVDRLVRLLPRDACGIFVGSGPDDEVSHIPPPNQYRAWHYRLKRPLTEADFSTFDKYASRIRVLSLGPLSWASNAVYKRGGELLFDIKQLRNPILPRLKTFYWTPDTTDGSLGGYFLLDGQLELLSLCPRSKIFPISPTAAPLQETAMVRAQRAFTQPMLTWLPNIPQLSISDINIPGRAHSSLPALSGGGGERLTNLQWLYCDLKVEPQFISDLSRLPHLQQLILFHVSPGPFGLSQGGFPSLETLKINSTLSSIVELLGNISSTNLHSVSLNVGDGQTWDRPRIFWDALLPNHIPARLATLTSFDFTLGSLAVSSLAPLYACRALERLQISASKIACTDADIRQMADAWPALKRLVLEVGSHSEAQMPTLYGLWPLATNCPYLELLELQLDARVDAPFDPERAGGGGGERLPSTPASVPEELRFIPIRSSCGDPAIVAAFLHVAFPRLHRDSLNPRCGRGDQSGSWWHVGARLALTTLVPK
ncbi:hypothetical protein HMN09_00798900 [Mycena chlorophos]|uniref:F-box domain-containing protein n=1 Tax=Mycena chlorophos TaxID=658473 RepID=A0A8H6W5C2_MYCCL|nr:hypothetical protein HMN09_00798900 [Mycena chlorophos]